MSSWFGPLRRWLWEWRADRAIGKWLREEMDRDEEYPEGSGPYGV